PISTKARTPQARTPPIARIAVLPFARETSRRVLGSASCRYGMTWRITAPGAVRAGGTAVPCCASLARAQATRRFRACVVDDRPGEGLEVARIARGDHAAVHHHLRVLPVRARIDDVRSNRFVGGFPAPLDDVGLDQQPGRVAHRGDELAAIVHGADELQ